MALLPNLNCFMGKENNVTMSLFQKGINAGKNCDRMIPKGNNFCKQHLKYETEFKSRSRNCFFFFSTLHLITKETKMPGMRYQSPTRQAVLRPVKSCQKEGEVPMLRHARNEIPESL